MAWSDPSAGQTLTAAKIAELASYSVPIRAEKAGDTSRNTLAVTTADPELVIVLPANRTYDIDIALHVSSAANAAGDFQMNWGWTNTATVTQGGQGLVNSLASGSSGSADMISYPPDSATPTGAISYGASTSRCLIEQRVTVVTGGSNVTLSLLWAQQASNANNTTLHAGSKVVARRVD